MSEFDIIGDSPFGHYRDVDGSLEVVKRDQIRVPVDLFFIQQVDLTTLTAATVIDSRIINVTDASGASVGDRVGIFEQGAAFYFGQITAISVKTLQLSLIYSLKRYIRIPISMLLKRCIFIFH